jgi:hypothetical protein
MANKSTAVKKAQKTNLALPSTDFEIKDDQIPETVEGVGELVRAMIESAFKSSLIYNWNVGKLIATIAEEGGGYGSGAVEKVAEQVQCSERILWAKQKFYKQHTSFDDIKDMAIEWSAAREISALTDPKKRKQLEKKTEKDNLTVKQVKEEVKKIQKADKPKEKKPSKPASPKALPFFMKLYKSLELIHKDLDGQLAKVPDMLAATSNDTITSDEDYNIIVEGTEKEHPLVTEIPRIAKLIISQCTMTILPLETSFNDPEEESPESSSSE